jgi:GLPGLI family protein
MDNIKLVTTLFLIKFTCLSAQIPGNKYALGDTIPIGKVTYSHQVHLGGFTEKNGTAELYFNNDRSLYLHLGNPEEIGDRYPNPQGVLVKSVGGDKQGAPIYKMHAEQKMLYRDLCVGESGRYIIADTLSGIIWTLHPNHKRFGQFDCRQATGIFHGREYEAWYTLDIPIPSGPFKLGGLPGLILEARATDGSADFLFVSIEISKEIPNRIKPPYGKDSGLNYTQYRKATWDFMESTINAMKAQGHDVSISIDSNALELWEPEK